MCFLASSYELFVTQIFSVTRLDTYFSLNYNCRKSESWFFPTIHLSKNAFIYEIAKDEKLDLSKVINRTEKDEVEKNKISGNLESFKRSMTVHKSADTPAAAVCLSALSALLRNRTRSPDTLKSQICSAVLGTRARWNQNKLGADSEAESWNKMFF